MVDSNQFLTQLKLKVSKHKKEQQQLIESEGNSLENNGTKMLDLC